MFCAELSMPLPAQVLAALICGPPCVWLGWRFFTILNSRRRAIAQHVRDHGLTSAAHIIVGLFLMATMVFMPFLCLPPRSSSANFPPATQLFLLFASAACVWVAASASMLLPLPSRFADYTTGRGGRRAMARALGLLHVANLQFVAMVRETYLNPTLSRAPSSRLAGFMCRGFPCHPFHFF